MPISALHVGLLAASIAVLAPAISIADQAQLSEVCARKPRALVERELDQGDPVNAIMITRLADLCGKRLHEMVDLSFGDGLRTYACIINVPRWNSMDGYGSLYGLQEQWKTTKALAGLGVECKTGRPLAPFGLRRSGGSTYLFLTRDGVVIDAITTREALDARNITVRSPWGAKDLIHLRDGQNSLLRPDLCTAKVEATDDGWHIRGLDISRNCTNSLKRNYFVSRTGRTEILSEEAGRVELYCAD